MEKIDALVQVMNRNAFYKRLHYLVFFAFVLALIVIVILISILVFLVKHSSNPIYFATDQVGKLIQVVPTDQPNMSLTQATAWAMEAVTSAYSYDYLNYRSQLQDAQKYFTNYGWSNYMSALSASNNLLALTQRKQIVIATVVDQPKLLAQGLLSGAYAWKFSMPLLVTYWEPPYDDKSKFYNPIEITVIIQRQPILQSYQGLGIVQLIARLSAGSSNQPQEISSAPTE